MKRTLRDEQGVPSDEGPATSIPPKKGQDGWLVTPDRWEREEPEVIKRLTEGDFGGARGIILRGLEEENNVSDPATRDALADKILKGYLG